MRRLIDLVLIVGILAAAGFGVYELGRHVDSTSNNLARRDSELNQHVYRPADPKGPSQIGRAYEMATGDWSSDVCSSDPP